METLTYWLAWCGIKLLQALPLAWAARIGRWGGGLVFLLDAPHRRVARSNLASVFAEEKSAREIECLAREHFRRLGENYASAVKAAGMSNEQLAPHLTVIGVDNVVQICGGTRGAIFAVGHFGNFELYARTQPGAEGFQPATTYRSLNHPKLDRLLARMRARSGCHYFERRRDGQALRAALARKSLLLGILADQHAGGGGAWIPFLGRICSTTTAPAIFAQRYKLPLFTSICFRTGLARWRIEFGDEIPTCDAENRRRAPADIMADVNRVFERAVRRDPANWFWVHQRWKLRKPPSARKKFRARAKKSRLPNG